DSLTTAFREGEGEVVIVTVDDEARLRFSERYRCPDHPDVKFFEPTPRFFSFNNPYGCCPRCTGFGATLEYDVALIVPNASRSLREGAVDPWEKPRYKKTRNKLLAFAKQEGASADVAWKDLPAKFRDAVIHGAKKFQGVI